MADKLTAYQQGEASPPEHNRAWPLYGAGFDNLGQDGQPIEIPVPTYGPNELLVRHDACGLCFSDIKVIKQGQEHARIYHDMKERPVVLGHEVSMTVIGVGENLRSQYKVGDRFIIQADIYVDGIGIAYGYEMQGGLSRYNVIDERVLEGDEGNYLLPLQETTGYAESALTEPWACVIAAYGLEYRTALKSGGIAWIIGAPTAADQDYTISAGFDASAHPATLLLTNVPPKFAAWLKKCAESFGAQVVQVDDIANPPYQQIDDIILLGADADIIEKTSPRLANFGVFAIMADKPLPGKIQVDIGRVHYNRWLYVGGKGLDIARAYSDVPVQAQLKPGGRAWMIGAAGPMGRMHVQRAIQIENGPKRLICTDISTSRLQDLVDAFSAEAIEKGIDFHCLNPREPADAAKIEAFKAQGFDDVIVMAPFAAAIAEGEGTLDTNGVLNVFAGVGRGTMVELDLSHVYLNGARYIGQSGSTIEDLRSMLNQAESGVLSPNRVVAALGSLDAARDGLKSVQDATFSGKVVIFPQIKDLPLTPLSELKEKMPTVYARLKDGREWTIEAEQEFLNLMLP